MRVLKEKVMGESRFLEEYQQAYEQCVYCLYNHPNRKGKARHLQDHNAPRVTLQWKEAKDIYEYFKPKSLPEFDGYKSETISAEVIYLELLMTQILTAQIFYLCQFLRLLIFFHVQLNGA